MLKIKIPQNGNDLNLNVNLKTQSKLSGLFDDITNLVTDTTKESVNKENDQEKKRFTPQNSATISFYFWNGSSYVLQISPTDFTSVNDLALQYFINSFYLIQVYTDYRESSNELLNSSYMGGYQINASLNSTYSFNKNYEYTDIHIPYSYLNQLTGNTFYLYFKFSFFSSKTGKMHLFYNNSTSLSKEEDMFIKVLFTKSTGKYTIVNPTLKEITNTTYVNNVNDSVDNVVRTKQIPPDGNIFTTDGEYTTDTDTVV